MKHDVLFVCLGNICRSPLAAAIARDAFADAGISGRVDSAGTGGWHAGERADPRMERVAEQHGYSLAEHRARQVERADFDRFDWILAMDRDNLAELHKRAPPDCRARIGLLLEEAGVDGLDEVPDPWFGEQDGFEESRSLLENAVTRLAARLRDLGS